MHYIVYFCTHCSTKWRLRTYLSIYLSTHLTLDIIRSILVYYGDGKTRLTCLIQHYSTHKDACLRKSNEWMSGADDLIWFDSYRIRASNVAGYYLCFSHRYRYHCGVRVKLTRRWSPYEMYVKHKAWPSQSLSFTNHLSTVFPAAMKHLFIPHPLQAPSPGSQRHHIQYRTAPQPPRIDKCTDRPTVA